MPTLNAFRLRCMPLKSEARQNNLFGCEPVTESRANTRRLCPKS